MPKWISAIFVFFLSTTLLKAKAITAEEIINNHKAATGIGKHTHNTHACGLLTSYKKKGYAARLAGVENINGKPCYKLSLKIKHGQIVNFLIDAQSWYIIRKPALQSGPVKQTPGLVLPASRLPGDIPNKPGIEYNPLP